MLAAVLGVAIAAGITWATSQLVSQHIGLASEPLTAGQRLLPKASAGAPVSTSTARPSSELVHPRSPRAGIASTLEGGGTSILDELRR